MIVFIVEDSEAMVERLGGVLAELPGIDVAGTASDAASAMDAIRRITPDAVIVDIRLRHGTGLDVLLAIRREQIRSTVVMLTNYAYPQYRSWCVRAGADYFFDKSTEFEAVQELFAGMARTDNGRTRMARPGPGPGAAPSGTPGQGEPT